MHIPSPAKPPASAASPVQPLLILGIDLDPCATVRGIRKRRCVLALAARFNFRYQLPSTSGFSLLFQAGRCGPLKPFPEGSVVLMGGKIGGKMGGSPLRARS